jgi:hypothetical protein
MEYNINLILLDFLKLFSNNNYLIILFFKNYYEVINQSYIDIIKD